MSVNTLLQILQLYPYLLFTLFTYISPSYTNFLVFILLIQFISRTLAYIRQLIHHYNAQAMMKLVIGIVFSLPST